MENKGKTTDPCKKNKSSQSNMKTSKSKKQSNSNENDSSEDGFLGRILHLGELRSQ